MRATDILAATTGAAALVALFLAFRAGTERGQADPPIQVAAQDRRDQSGSDQGAVTEPGDGDRDYEALGEVRAYDEGSQVRDDGPGWDKTGLRDIAMGLAMIVAGVLALVVPGDIVARLVVAAIALAGGLAMLKRGSSRQHGLAVERRALKKIQKIALRPGWELKTGLPIAGKGDVDLLIRSPDDTRFVVEIKAQKEIVLRRGLLGGRAQVLGKGGQKLPRDPLNQVLTLGGILQAVPVLWFPDGRGAPVTKIGDPEVIVVQGPPRVLLREIGATRGWFGFPG